MKKVIYEAVETPIKKIPMYADPKPELRVTLKLSDRPARYHLLEIIRNGATAVVQIEYGVDVKALCEVVAHVRGLGAI